MFLFIFFSIGRNYRLSLSSSRFFLLLTSVNKYTECSVYNLYLPLFRFVETGLTSSGNRFHFFLFSTTFHQQLMAATSCTSGTVNELSAFKNLFHLVCPYFTDHARIANKSKSAESMQIILYLVLFQVCIRCFL